MTKPTAIIDKSLLQRICDPRAKTDFWLGQLHEKYSLVAPLILIEETLDNLVQPPKRKPRAVFPAMIKRLKEIHPLWMNDVWDISYQELVLGESLDFIPWLSEDWQRMVFDFKHDDAKALTWVFKRRQSRDEYIQKRKIWQKGKIPPGKFFLERDEETFFEKLTSYFLKELSEPISRNDILDTILGDVFVHRHPEWTADIKAALSKVNDSNINEYPFSRNFLIATFVYMIGPITKVLVKPIGKQQPQKVLDRQDQRNNLEDQEYVASAFLCNRLLTADQPMVKVMRMFEARGIWRGKTVCIDKSKRLDRQIPARLV